MQGGIYSFFPTPGVFWRETVGYYSGACAGFTPYASPDAICLTIGGSGFQLGGGGASSILFGSHSNRSEGFVARARALERLGEPDAALDLVYDCMDDLLYSQQLALVASLLLEVDVAECSVGLLLALLTSTLPARLRIGTRADFARRVEAELSRRGENATALLAGLT